MKSVIAAWSLWFLTGSGIPASNVKAVPPKGEIRIDAKAIHPLLRTNPTPVGHAVDVNPPAFLWPSVRTEFTEPLLEYDFQLSRRQDFSQIKMSLTKVHPSFAVPDGPLEKGEWFWRYRESGAQWKGPYRFTVDGTSRQDLRPSAQAFVQSVSGPHPRIVIPRERLEEVRASCVANGTTASILKTADSYVGIELPDCDPLIKWAGRESEQPWVHDDSGKFFRKGKRIFWSTKFPPEHVKSQMTAPIWEGAISSLCRAYLLTEEERYAAEALRWGMQLTKMEMLPKTNLTYDGNPYPDGFCFSQYLDSMSCLYDCLYDYMTEEQRADILKNIAERLRIYYQYYCNRVENRCLDNHTWQISLGAFVRAALIGKGDLPEADEYLTYAYNLWTARDPEQSRTDGGWFGGGYVGVNIGVWTEIPAYFRKYTGYNFYDHPYYRNHPLWFLYRQPPGSVEDGFSGDGYGGEGRGCGAQVAAWLDILDADLDLPVAGWLADSVNERRDRQDVTFAWARRTLGLPLANPRRAEPPSDLPQAHAFRDVGIVNMHRDMLHPENDLHVALRSSPYGTFGHNLASHNAFNVIYQGDYLFVPYGHRFGGAKNSAACYRHTRGHNSVLVDGKGQPYSPEAYGWIARFLHGEKITYACGDASNAYDAEVFGREEGIFAAAGLSADDHISRGVVTRFRRHLLFLRPSLVVIYDELEAREPVRWDWVLHCRREMTAEGTVLSVQGVQASVDVRGSLPMKVVVESKPMFMPINVDGRGGQEPGSTYPVKGCHAYVSSETKTDKLRILTFMQVGEHNDIRVEGDALICGQWAITAQMNVNAPANVMVQGKDHSSEFILRNDSGQSVLSETISSRRQVFRAVDELPYDALDLEWVANIENPGKNL